jgi:DNA-binding CsgD family transcriptional regulator
MLMTHLLLLLDEAAILLLDSPLPAGVLAGSINAGVWQPPENLPELSGAAVGALHAISLSGMVVASPTVPFTRPQRKKSLAAHVSLTPRQQQVLQCLAEGLTNRQIAARLGITVRAVGFHVEKLKARLNTRSRYQAAASLADANPAAGSKEEA